MDPWTLGDIIETKGGIWELAYIGITTYVLRNDSGRLHVLFVEEMNQYCTKVEV